MEVVAKNVVDVSLLLQGELSSFKESASAKVCHALVKEIAQSGFVLLKNHGVTAESIQNITSKADAFFAQDVDFKKQFSRKGIDGWTGPGMESLNPGTPGDYKEAYNYSPMHCEDNWPESGLCEAYKEVFKQCKIVSKMVLNSFAIGLDLEDPELFAKGHCTDEANSTNLRCALYPPVPDDLVEEEQLRCGEHSDFGSITLLFQDGGLEVLSETGKWLSPPSVPGTVMVIVGDLMQRWTGDRLKAIIHRVGIPAHEKTRKTARKSIMFFVQPDNEWIVESVMGTKKYPPVKTIDYFQAKVDELY